MIRIYGSNDDLIEIEGIDLDEPEDEGEPLERTGLAKRSAAEDELGALDSDVGFIIGEPVGKDAHGVSIIMEYDGQWRASIAPIDDHVECPWPLYVSLKGHSAVVEVDCPDGTAVKIYERDK